MSRRHPLEEAGSTQAKRLSKAARQHRIAQIIEASPVSSQSQLVSLLAEAGVEATQATVSRDLEEMGVIRIRSALGESIYALPETPLGRSEPEDHLRRVLGEWVVEVSSSANLVVVRTPPGCAHVVASALDRAGLEGVLGTVAGDDTLLMVAAEELGGTALAGQLRSLAGL